METTNLDKYLHTVRRIEEHREEKAVKELKRLYKRLIKEYRAQMGGIYAQYANTETGKLSYAELHARGLDARLLEEVAAKMNDVTQAEKRTIQTLVEETYSACYSAMTEAVSEAVDDASLNQYFAQVDAAKPQALAAAVNNPVHGLTLPGQLEKNRADIIYTIKQAVGIGLSVGDRYDTMARRIQKALIGPDGAGGSYAKSIRIARTEAHRCREAGNLDAGKALSEKLQPAGVELDKTWRTMKDERVRPNKSYKTKKGWKYTKGGKYNHVAMEGVTVPIGEKFKLPSGAETMAPGQSGVAGEDINCRCFLSYSVRRKAAKVDYLIQKHPGAGDISKEREIFKEAFSEIPAKVQQVMSGTVVDIGQNGACQYDYDRDILYVAKGAGKDAVFHEIGHLVDKKLVNHDKAEQLKKKILKVVSPFDLVQEIYYDANNTPYKIFLIKSDKFVSEYQGRVYINDCSELLDGNMNIRPELFMEFISEPYREYMEDPKRLKKEFPEFYELLKEAVE